VGAFALLLAALLVPRYLAVGTIYFSRPGETASLGLELPLQLVNAALWREGVPLWNPWSGCGTPQLANPNAGVFYPLNALFLVLPATVAGELLVVARLLFAGLACLGLGRVLGLSRGGALFLALAYALNVWMLHTAKDAVANGWLLLPWTVAAWLRLGETGGRRPLAAAALLSALHWLAGEPEAAAAAIALGVLVFSFAARGASWGAAGRRLGVLAATLAGGALVAAVQWLPFVTSGLVAHADPVPSGSAPGLLAGLSAVAQPLIGRPAFIGEMGLPLGAVVLLFAARGLLRPLRGGVNLLLAGVAVLGALLRSTSPTLTPVTILSVSALAALGLDDWWRAPRERAWRLWAPMAALLVAAWWHATGAAGALRIGPYAVMLLAVTLGALAVAFHRDRLRTERPAQMIVVVLALLVGERWLHDSRIPNDITAFTRFYEEPLTTGSGGLGAFLDQRERARFRARSPVVQLGAFLGPRAEFDDFGRFRAPRAASYRAAVGSPENWTAQRLLDVASVGAAVSESGPGALPHDLMPGVHEGGLRSWEGADPPEFVDDERSLVRSTTPFAGSLRWFGIGHFDRLSLGYGCEIAADRSVEFTVTLESRKETRVIFEDTLEPGTADWRRALVLLPAEVALATLTFAATSPDGASANFAFGDLLLLRPGQDEASRRVAHHESQHYLALENPAALARARFCTEAVVAPAEEVFGVIQSVAFTPGRTVVLERPPPTPLTDRDEPPAVVRTIASSSRLVTVEVDTSTAGVLVLADAYDPKWKAHVDGEEVEVLVADGLFRGVPLEPGSHRIEFTYDRWSFQLGAALSLLGLLGLLVTARRAR
jgi:hypothetical protein